MRLHSSRQTALLRSRVSKLHEIVLVMDGSEPCKYYVFRTPLFLRLLRRTELAADSGAESSSSLWAAFAFRAPVFFTEALESATDSSSALIVFERFARVVFFDFESAADSSSSVSTAFAPRLVLRVAFFVAFGFSSSESPFSVAYVARVVLFFAVASTAGRSGRRKPLRAPRAPDPDSRSRSRRGSP